MSRREIVVLVSRALAIIEFVAAFLDLAYLPIILMELVHYSSGSGHVGSFVLETYTVRYYQVEAISLIIRTVGLLILGIVLWNCGPWIESKLLPALQPPQQSVEPAN